MKKHSLIPMLLLTGALMHWAVSTGWCGSGALPVLSDITRPSGLTFVHGFGDDNLSNIVESAGPGVAFADYDNDGDLDIYLVNGCYNSVINHPQGRSRAGKLSNALYRNNGDTTFTDVTESAGVGDKGYGMACLFGDIDNDGDQDLYVTNYGPNRLFRNNGDGTFSDITDAAGVGCGLWSLGCTFLDYDEDGFLDLYVGNYLDYDPDYRNFYAGDGFPGPLAYPGQADILYRNNGDGTFEDVTRRAGLFAPQGRAMGVASCDIDDDGHVDIFVANDAMQNYLYRNNGDGTFTDISFLSGTGFGQNGEATSAMSPEFGDFNGDGRIDILIPDMGYGSLFINNGDAFFSEMSSQSGLASACGQYTSWSGNLFDINNDTLLDVLLTNGDSHFFEPEEDIVLLNTDGKRLEDISKRIGPDFQQKGMGRGSAVGDIDNDGDLDILITNINGSPVLYRNDGGNTNHWLMMDLKGTSGNRDAVGARVWVIVGGRELVRDVLSSSGYLSQSDHRLHFGLGDHDTVTSVIIRWPGGKQTVLQEIKADRLLLIEER